MTVLYAKVTVLYMNVTVLCQVLVWELEATVAEARLAIALRMQE